MKKSVAWSLAVAAMVLMPLSFGCGGSPAESQIVPQVERAAQAQQQGLSAETNAKLICSAVCTCTPNGCDCSQIVCVEG